MPDTESRARFQRVKPAGEIGARERGWTLDVLNLVHRISEEKRQRAGALHDASRSPEVAGKRASVLNCGGPPPLWSASACLELTNEEGYAFAHELEKLHPDNRHVKDNIRQQLQVLRDAGWLLHAARGRWRLPGRERGVHAASPSALKHTPAFSPSLVPSRVEAT